MKRKNRKATKKDSAKENGEALNGDADSADNTVDEPQEKKSRSRSSSRGGTKNPPPAKSEEEDSSSNEEDNESNNEEDDEKEGEYEVEYVLGEKKIKGVRHYLIRWKGYEPESDTWEPESTLDCPELIADFKNQQKKKNDKSIQKKKKGVSSAKKKESKADWDENDVFEVDRILEVHFKKSGQREFLVHWKGYPATDSSWEPESNLNCKDLIEKFMSKVEKAKELESRELRQARTHTDRFTLTMEGSNRRISKRYQGKQRVHYHDAE